MPGVLSASSSPGLGRTLHSFLRAPSPQFIELCILLGCDYLEPIRGVGPKSALKLMKEYGSLGKVVEHLREKMALKAQESEKKAKKRKVKDESEDEDMEADEGLESEDETMPAGTQDPPAASSDVDGGGIDDDDDDEADDAYRQEPDNSDNDDGADERRKMQEDEAKKAAAASKKKKSKSTSKSDAPAPSTTSRRGAGGVHVPESWMWEEAKKLFKTPDVTPASELEVRSARFAKFPFFVAPSSRRRSTQLFGCLLRSSQRRPIRRIWIISRVSKTSC